MLKDLRFWGKLTAGTAAGSLLAALVFTGATWHTPWRLVLDRTAANFLFSFSSMSLGFLTIPRLAPIVWRRLPVPLNWAAVAAALIGCATAGSFIAMLVVTGLGLVPAGQFFPTWSRDLRISIYFTLIFGIFFTVTFVLRARLDEAALALRTKERDEAEARRLAAEAQLASLESRIDPHFLFNTLNSVSELVHENPAAAERVVGQLASLMRSSLDRGALALVPLAQELDFVRKYLDIERVRFGDRLRYTIDVPPALGSALVPRLSLQTLVENSVKYAASPRREGASVAVQAAAGNGQVHIDVIDNGPGFDPSSSLAGHGLALLRARLAIQFGDRAALRIASKPGHTVATLDLPVEPPATSSEPRTPRHDSLE